MSLTGPAHDAQVALNNVCTDGQDVIDSCNSVIAQLQAAGDTWAIPDVQALKDAVMGPLARLKGLRDGFNQADAIQP